MSLLTVTLNIHHLPTDVQFKVQDTDGSYKYFPAHKPLLACVSGFFYDWFCCLSPVRQSIFICNSNNTVYLSIPTRTRRSSNCLESL